MYTLSNKLRITAYVCIVLGLIGIVLGFLNAPKTVEEAHAIVEAASAHHGGGHETDDAHVVKMDDHHGEAVEAHHGEEAHHGAEASADEHGEHVLHQLQNRPWSAVLIAGFFFFMIALGTLVFYAVQRVAQAGWSPVLFRVMEAITSYLVPGGIILFVFFVLTVSHFNHLYLWMEPGITDHDAILAGKSGYLNIPFFIIRSAVFIGGWIAYRFISKKYSLAQDEATDDTYYKKNFKISVFFLLFFFVSETLIAWDWFMSLEPHWYSTLFAWYIFATMFVSAITVIAMSTIYLKSKGLLEHVNDSHLHDLAKFMFGLSVFWTYLWFAQFMLQWYANIPEESGYMLPRVEHYNALFFGMVAINFIFPFLILMNSDFKRKPWFIFLAGAFILVGHYIDLFQVVMPSTVGEHWGFGIPEIGAILFFLGLFLVVVTNAFAKTKEWLPKRDPFIEESKHFHY